MDLHKYIEVLRTLNGQVKCAHRFSAGSKSKSEFADWLMYVILFVVAAPVADGAQVFWRYTYRATEIWSISWDVEVVS